MPAAYPPSDLLTACRAAADEAERGTPAPRWPVRLVGGSKETACDDLGLTTEKEALAFLGQLTTADLRPENLGVPLEKTPFGSAVVLVDAYEVNCGGKIAYLAFYKNPLNGVWNIKSLKLNSKSPLTHSPFALLLAKKDSPDDERK